MNLLLNGLFLFKIQGILVPDVFLILHGVQEILKVLHLCGIQAPGDLEPLGLDF